MHLQAGRVVQMIVTKAYKFRMYPNEKQRILINKTFGCSNLVYNKLLDKKKTNPKLSKYYLASFIPGFKQELEFLKEVDSMALVHTAHDVTVGYDKYLSGKGGMPHFKKKGVKVSYTTNCIRSSYKSKSYANIMVDMKNRTIVLPKLGCVKIRGYRNLKEFPFRIINATVSKVANKYYVSVVVEEDIKSKYAKTYHIVGIDLGIKSLVTTSSFESYGNVSSLKKHEKRIAILQQKLAKKEKNSKNYNKIKMKLERAYLRLANSRKKQAEEIVSKLLKENDYIVAENLQVNKMITESSSKSLRKNIIHSTFSLILTKLRQKCLWENKRFIQVNTYFPSSQLCSCCRHRNEEMKDLKLREYKCSECGNILDRDINASLNILNEGIKMAFGL